MRLGAYRDSRIGLLVKDILKETLKSYFLWDFWRFGLMKLLKKLLNPTSCEISGDFGWKHSLPEILACITSNVQT